MVKRDFIKGSVKNVILILLGMLIASLFIVGSAIGQSSSDPTSGGSTSDTATAGAALLDVNAPEGQVWISCTPTEVAVYGSRIHVRCAAAVAGIRFFAVSTTDASNAARVLSVLSTAHVAGRTLSILYDTADTSGTAIGCQASDCRLIISAVMQ